MALRIFVFIRAVVQITTLYWDFFLYMAQIDLLILLDFNSSSVPPVEIQCRVIKRWPHLSSLLVEVLPWCLLVNNTAVPMLVRDLEREVTVFVSPGSVVAPHRITVWQR